MKRAKTNHSKDLEKLEQLVVECGQLKRKAETEHEDGSLGLSLKVIAKLHKQVQDKLTGEILLLAESSDDAILKQTVKNSSGALAQLGAMVRLMELLDPPTGDDNESDGGTLCKHAAILLKDVRSLGWGLSRNFDLAAFELVALHFATHMQSADDVARLRAFMSVQESVPDSQSDVPYDFGYFVPSADKRAQVRESLFGKIVLHLMSAQTVLAGDGDQQGYTDALGAARRSLRAWTESFVNNVTYEQDWLYMVSFDPGAGGDAQLSNMGPVIERITACAEKGLTKVLAFDMTGKPQVPLGARLKKDMLEELSRWTEDRGYELDLKSALASCKSLAKPKAKDVLTTRSGHLVAYENLRATYLALLKNSSPAFQKRRSADLEQLRAAFAESADTMMNAMTDLCTKTFQCQLLINVIDKLADDYDEALFVDLSAALSVACKIDAAGITKPYQRSLGKCYLADDVRAIEELPRDVSKLWKALSGILTWVQSVGNEESRHKLWSLLSELEQPALQTLKKAIAIESDIPLVRDVAAAIQHFLCTIISGAFDKLCLGFSKEFISLAAEQWWKDRVGVILVSVGVVRVPL